jgi:hypothetical protein
VHYAIFWLNAFPPSSGVSASYSPRTIITGTSLYLSKHCKLPFGAYSEVHEEHPQTNTMAQRTRGVICSGPTGNFLGSYKMMCIRTGRKVTRKKFQELPMPDSVIKQIEAIAEKEKQEKTLVFSDRNADPIGDGDDEDITAGVDDKDYDDDANDGVDNNPSGISINATENEEN